MAFCRYCGRELQEGEVCSCRDQGETPKTEVADAVSIQGKQIAGEAWKDFIRLLKSPASYAGSYVKSGNMVTAILFLVLQAICSSIFAVLCIGKINGLIGLGGSMTESLKFSSVGGFFLTLFYSLLLSVALTALYLGGSKLLRGELSIQQALSAVSVRSVILVPVKLVGCLLFMLNIPAGIILFYCAGALAGMGFLGAGSEGVAGLSGDRRTYLTIAIAIVFALVFVLFAFWVFPTYIPSTIREFFSWENIINTITSQ